MKTKNAKGQIFSTELVLASGVFIAALVAFVFVWNSMSDNYQEGQQDMEMQTVLQGISDSLVLSPGYPTNWEAAATGGASSIVLATSSFGLADSPNGISGAKAAELQALNSSYLDVKERMGAGRFDVFVSIGDTNRTFYTFGYAPDLNDTTVRAISEQRPALLNGSAVTLKVQVWRIRGKVI